MADIKFKMGFQLDKKGINEVKAELSQISKQLESGNTIKIDDNELKKVKKNVEILDKALDKAFDKDLNKLNLKSLNAELKKSGTSLTQLQADLERSGVVGTNAFSNIHKEVLKTGVEAKKTKTVLDDMVDTLGKTVKWNLASGAINTIQGSIQRAVGFVKNLDNSLNNIRIVTGKSSKEMEVFAEQANVAAKALGKTTTEYTDASLIFFQQGKTAAEVRELTEATLIGASITGENVSNMADYLTAVMNGYVLEASRAMEVTDKLAAVGAATGSDFRELAVGMSKVASAAKVMEVPFDNLNAMLATVSTVTREAPETIGTTFKTIFARMSELKAGGKDEEGWTTGKVEEALNMIGVSVIDKETNEMREMGEVIDEVGNKWATLNKESKVGVAVAMAGQRQSSRLMALFENWDMYTDAVQTSETAMGSALEQNNVRMDSLEYKTKQLRAESEELWGKIIDQDALISMTEGLTSVMERLNDLVDGFGGFGEVLTVVGGIATNVFSKQFSDILVKTGDNLKNIKNQISEGMQEMKTGKPGMNQSELSVKSEIEANLSSGAITEATGKVDNKVLEDRVRLRKQEEEITKRLSEEEIKKFQATKNEIIEEQEKLKLLAREREEISKAAEQRIKETKSFGKMYQDSSSILEIEEKITSKKEEALKLEKEYTQQVKAIEDLKVKGYSIDDLQYIKLKQGTTELTSQERILLKALKNNELNVDSYETIEDLVRDIDEVHDSIIHDLEVQQGLLEEIEQTELDIQGIREQEQEIDSPEMEASKKRIEGLQKEGEEIEKNALKHAKVEKVVQGVGTALGIIGSMKGLKVLGDEAASAEDQVNAINSSLNGIGTTLLSTGNPYAMVAGGVAILAGGFVKLAHEMSPVNKAIKENTKVLEEQNKVIGEAQQRVKDLKGVQSQFKELQDAMAVEGGAYASVGDLDTESFEKYTQLANEVASVAPQLVSYYDEMGNAIIDLNSDFDSLIEKEKQTIMIANEAKAANVKNFAIEYESIISDAENQIIAKQKLIANIGKYGTYEGKDSSDIGAIVAEINGLQTKIQETQGMIGQNIIDPIFSGSEAYAGLTKNAQGYVRELVDATRVSQKLNDPESLSQYTSAVDRFMGALAEKNVEVAESIEEVKVKMRELQKDGVSEAELDEYNALKENLDELQKKIIPVSEAFDNLGESNKQNVIEMSGLIQEQVEDYDTLIAKLSEYYGDTQNMLQGPMQASDLMSMGGIESGYSRADASEQEIADIDSKLLELANQQGEIRNQREEFKREIIDSGEMVSPEQLEQMMAYDEAIRGISEQEKELRDTRLESMDNQVEAHVAMIEEAKLQAEMNEMYDQQINAMLETTEGYNQIAEGVNGMNAAIEDFNNIQSELSDNMSPEGMDQYVASLEQYADQIPGLSEAIQQYKTDGASAFDGVKDAAGTAFADIKRQADKLYISLNKDNADFYQTFLTDNKNMTKLAEVEYGVRANDFKTYAEYETALDNAKKRGKINNLSDEQRAAILAHDNIENSYWNSATGQLETSNALSENMQNDVNNTGQTAASAYSQMRKSGVSVADSIRYAFAVMVDKVSGGWANMINSLIDALNGGLQGIAGFVNSGIEMLNGLIPGEKWDISYRADWGNIGHISGSNYSSSVADSIKDKYAGQDDYDWTVSKPGNVGLKPPSGSNPGFEPGGTNDSNLDGPGISPGGGDKGGSSGGDKGGSEKEVEDLEWEEDIYHDINIQLEQKQQLLDKLQKQQDKLYGKELLDNLAKQKQALQDQQKLLEKKLEMQKKDLEQQKQALSKQGVQFNVDGTIANYNALLAQKLAYVNSLSGEAKEAAKEEFSALIKMMEAYEDMMMNSIFETENAIQDSIDAQREIFIQEFEYEINIQLELSKDFQDAMEFLKDMSEGFESGSGDYEYTTKQLIDQMDAIGKIQAQIDKINKDTSLTDKERIEMLEEQAKLLKDAIKNANALNKELTKIFKDTLKEGLDMTQEHLNQYKDINKELKFLEQTLKLIGEGDNYEVLDSIYQEQYDSIMGQIDALNKQNEVLKAQREALKAANMEGTEEWKAIDEAINKTTDSINSLATDAMKTLQAEFKNSVEEIMSSLENALTGDMGFDELKKQQKELKDERKKYLDGEEKLIAINKLQKKLQKEIDSTDDPAKKAKLQKFMDTELKALKEKDKLTKYDVDRANLVYDLTLKQMALEEQRAMKNTMRLVRDTQGNWVYEFTEDAKAVEDAQNATSDALEKLMILDKKRLEETQDEMLKIQEEYYKEVQKITQDALAGKYKTEEEVQKALEEAANKYNEKMLVAQEDYEYAKQNATISSMGVILDSYITTGNQLEGLTQEQQDALHKLAEATETDFLGLQEAMKAILNGDEDSIKKAFDDLGINIDTDMKDIVGAVGSATDIMKKDWNLDISDMISKVVGDGGFKDATSTAISSIMSKWNEYQNKMTEVKNNSGLNLNDIKDKISSADKATEELNKETDALINKLNSGLSAVTSWTTAFKNQRDQIQGLIKDTTDYIKKLDELISKKKQEATGVGGSTPNQGGGGSSSGGSSSGGSSGGSSTPKPPPTAPGQGSKVRVKPGRRWYYDSYGTNPSGPTDPYSNRDLFVVNTSKNKYQYAVGSNSSINSALGWLRKEDLQGFDTGGYTGAWGKEGRMALLHEKEIVLNKADTKNLLNAVKLINESGIASMLKRFGGAMSGAFNSFTGSSPDGTQQNIVINADFSGVKNSNEIEKAFENMANMASQYSHRR